jgi:hypothetical protein
MHVNKAAPVWTIALALLTTAPVVHAAPDTSARALVERTIDAFGVQRDVRQLPAVRTSVQGVTFDLVENNHPGPPYPVQGFSTATVVADYQGGREVSSTASGSRTVLTRLAQLRLPAASAAAPGPAIPAPPSWETQDPIRALLLARSAADLKREPDQQVHGALQHVLSFHNGRYPVRIFIDDKLGLPSATEAIVTYTNGAPGTVAWNGWGDLTERAEFMNYDLKDGLRYPQQTDIYVNGEHYRAVTRSDLRIGAEEDAALLAALPDIPAPPRFDINELALGQIAPNGPDPKRGPAELAPGIVQFPGSWYVTLVRQDDGIVIIDAPISAGYSRRVLDEAARRFPGVPVKAVITSTAFFWHVGGIREYAALGVPIYVRDRNLPILRSLLAAPHTLAPDALSRTPRTPILRAVSAPTMIGSGKHAIKVMPVRYGEQPMLMSWIEDAHILHTAEMVQPLGPNGSLLFPEALLEISRSVSEAGIDTEGLSIIGMHMSATPWGAVCAALAVPRCGT